MVVEAEKRLPKSAHFVAFRGGKKWAKMGLDGQLGGQLGGQFEQATTPLMEKIEAKNATNGQKHTL